MVLCWVGLHYLQDLWENIRSSIEFFQNRTLYILKLFLGYIRLAKFIIFRRRRTRLKPKSYIHNTLLLILRLHFWHVRPAKSWKFFASCGCRILWPYSCRVAIVILPISRDGVSGISKYQAWKTSIIFRLRWARLNLIFTSSSHPHQEKQHQIVSKLNSIILDCFSGKWRFLNLQNEGPTKANHLATPTQLCSNHNRSKRSLLNVWMSLMWNIWWADRWIHQIVS